MPFQIEHLEKTGETIIYFNVISYDIYTCWLIPRIRFVGYIPSLPSQTGGISRVNPLKKRQKLLGGSSHLVSGMYPQV